MGPCSFAEVPDSPQTLTLNILWVQEKETPVCMSEWSQGFILTQNVGWVSSSAPHLLHEGLLVSPIKWRCLLKVVCPVRRPVTILDCILLKDRSLILVVGLGPGVSFQACLWVLIRPHHITICWLSIQHIIFLLIFYLEIPKAVSYLTNFWTAPSLVS
jgi:hypothetical protein